MSRANSDIAQKIISLGHWVGIHYDYSYYQGNTKTKLEWIQFESQMMSELLGVRINTISFHQPDISIVNQEVDTGDLINTYHHPFVNGFHYISDSNRIFKEPIHEVIIDKKYTRLQLLIHPMWWMYSHNSRVDVWNRVITNNFCLMQEQLLKTERAYGSKRSIILGGDNDA